MSNHTEIFTKIYETCFWGDNENENYKGSSGIGSDINYNINTYVPFLKKFIINNEINTIIDLGCGDFQCGKYIYEDLINIKYYGYDAYDKVIENNKMIYDNTNNTVPKYTFIQSDFYQKKEDIISGDLCILKDVIMHWTINEIYTFLDYLTESKKFKYILLCNCRNQTSDNSEITTGEWRELSVDYFPLKKYNPIKLYHYRDKEVSVICT